jgi:hypothetical protein
MNADGFGREEMQMSTLINTARPRLVIVKPWQGREGDASSFAANCEGHESLTIPNRGIVFGSLLSGVLWAVLILVVHEVWLYLR